MPAALHAVLGEGPMLCCCGELGQDLDCADSEGEATLADTSLSPMSSCGLERLAAGLPKMEEGCDDKASKSCMLAVKQGPCILAGEQGPCMLAGEQGTCMLAREQGPCMVAGEQGLCIRRPAAVASADNGSRSAAQASAGDGSVSLFTAAGSTMTGSIASGSSATDCSADGRGATDASAADQVCRDCEDGLCSSAELLILHTLVSAWAERDGTGLSACNACGVSDASATGIGRWLTASLMATGLSLGLLPAELAASSDILALIAKLISPELPADLPSRPPSMWLVSTSAQGLRVGPLSTPQGAVFEASEKDSIDNGAGCAWVTENWSAKDPS